MVNVSITVNGQEVTADIDERTLLLEFVRDVAGLTGTHNGCLEARCGCCSVELDGAIVKSCNVLALQAAGHSVTTIEDLSPQRLHPAEHITSGSLANMYQPLDMLGADAADLHPVQAAFHKCHALQCGFCTPGMVMAATSLLAENPSPTETQVREGLEGNFCRCTGYHNIVRAVLAAAAAKTEGGLAEGGLAEGGLAGSKLPESEAL
jgi:carbon-monoxide dehydrogenase small subunit